MRLGFRRIAWFSVMDRDCMKKDDDPVGFRTLSIDDCGDDSWGIRVMDRRNENMVMVVGRQDTQKQIE